MGASAICWRSIAKLTAWRTRTSCGGRVMFMIVMYQPRRARSTARSLHQPERASSRPARWSSANSGARCSAYSRYRPTPSRFTGRRTWAALAVRTRRFCSWNRSHAASYGNPRKLRTRASVPAKSSTHSESSISSSRGPRTVRQCAISRSCSPMAKPRSPRSWAHADDSRRSGTGRSTGRCRADPVGNG